MMCQMKSVQPKIRYGSYTDSEKNAYNKNIITKFLQSKRCKNIKSCDISCDCCTMKASVVR